MSETSTPSEAVEFSQDQLERGAAALFPFVEAFGLPLNPEDLDLMAYAVLRHAGTAGDAVGPDAISNIVSDTQAMITLHIDDQRKLHTALRAKPAN